MILFAGFGGLLDRVALVLAFQLLGMGWFIATSIVFGALLGIWLDSILSTGPAFLVTGLLTGLATASYGAYKMVLPLIKKYQNTKDAN